MKWSANGRRVTREDGQHVCDCASEGGAELAQQIADEHNAAIAMGLRERFCACGNTRAHCDGSRAGCGAKS